MLRFKLLKEPKSLTLTLEALLAETPAKETRLCERLQKPNLEAFLCAQQPDAQARHIPQNRQIHL